VRAGQGVHQPGSTLPMVPPPEEDELISSWLDRTARFYEQPLQALLGAISPAGKPIHLAAVDLGHPRVALSPVAKLLGLSPDGLLPHTVVAFPPAGELVASSADKSTERLLSRDLIEAAGLLAQFPATYEKEHATIATAAVL